MLYSSVSQTEVGLNRVWELTEEDATACKEVVEKGRSIELGSVLTKLFIVRCQTEQTDFN